MAAHDSKPERAPVREGSSQDGASNASSISSTLLDQLRAGGPEAWHRLVRLYGPVTYRWCRRSNLSAEDAADVVQEVLSAVMIHLPDFRRDRPQDSFSGWLATITRNKVREHYRRRQGKAEARGGSTAQRQMAEIPQPQEISEESIQTKRRVGCLPVTASVGDDPGGVRGPYLGSLLAGECRRAVAGRRRFRPRDECCGRLYGQISGAPPFPNGARRIAGVSTMGNYASMISGQPTMAGLYHHVSISPCYAGSSGKPAKCC